MLYSAAVMLLCRTWLIFSMGNKKIDDNLLLAITRKKSSAMQNNIKQKT